MGISMKEIFSQIRDIIDPVPESEHGMWLGNTCFYESSYELMDSVNHRGAMLRKIAKLVSVRFDGRDIHEAGHDEYCRDMGDCPHVEEDLPGRGLPREYCRPDVQEDES